MSDVTFAVGRSGSGKSRMIRSYVSSLRAAGHEVILIVPEQFTFETERELSVTLTGGLLGVHVYSFTTLASRVLEQSGERTVFLSKQGRLMTVRRCASEAGTELTAFSRVYERAGFADKCDELFSMFKRFEITPEKLTSVAEKFEEGMLRRKIKDLALLYSKTQNALDKMRMDSDDAFNALIRLLPDSSLKGSHVIIDGFDLLTNQLYHVIETIMDTACSLTVTIRADVSAQCRDKSVFVPEIKAYTRLKSKAYEKGCNVKTVMLPVTDAPWGETRYKSAALKHLEHEAFAYPFTVYDGEPDGIELFAGTDANAEAEAVADAVYRAAAGGMRYRDMAVVACDMDEYRVSVTRAFSKRGIPYFTDEMHKLSAYPLSRLIRHAVSVCASGYNANDLVAMLKTDLTGVDRDDTEIFENYVLATGVRSSAFERPFVRQDVPIEAERAREKLMEGLEVLKNGLGRARTASEKTEVLYAYLESLGVREKLEELSMRLQEEGRLELMSENQQVYNCTIELLSQLHAIMGSVRISNRRYLSVLTEGLDAYEVGAIPTTADQVLFGSVGRTRQKNVRAMFIIGARSGAFPQTFQDDGVIDDAELAALSDAGLETWDSVRDRSGVERLNTYTVLARASDMLYISYPMRTGTDTNVPCAVIDRIKAAFPTVKEHSDVDEELACHESESALVPLISALRRYADTSEPGALAPLYAWYFNRAEYAHRLSLISEAVYHKSSPPSFGAAYAKKLYGEKLSGSATRLELFNACEFNHFMRYGMMAMERKEYSERTVDEGSFCHEALSLYVNALRDIEPASVTQNDCNGIIDTFMPELIATHNGGVLLESARSKNRASELVDIVKRTAWAITCQLARGTFKVEGTEVSFGASPGSLPPIEIRASDGTRFLISGKIDRLDSFEADGGEKFFRVVDYKSGDRDFSYSRLYHGLSLQLPLYAAAVLAADRAAHTAGMYYQSVKSPTPVTASDVEVQVQRQFRLMGLTLADSRVIAASGGDTADAVQLAKARLLGEDACQTLVSYALEKSAKTLERITSGTASVSPCRTGKRETTCKNCVYASCCRFDTQLPSCKYRDVRRLDAKDFFAAVKKERLPTNAQEVVSDEKLDS